MESRLTIQHQHSNSAKSETFFVVDWMETNLHNINSAILLGMNIEPCIYSGKISMLCRK